MKVRCIKLVNPNTGSAEKKNSWLTIGRIYHVLSVEKDVCHSVQYRLTGDANDIPALHDAGQFEVVSNKIPSNWVVNVEQGGSVEFAPLKWISWGYWEKYFDGEVEAIQVYKEESRRILEEDP